MRIKPIPNFPDYYITSTGIVLSKMKRANQSKPKEFRTLATWLSFGYKTIRLQRNKKAYKRFVHRLVLEAFVGNSPRGYQCRHLDNDKLNNNLSNLKWGTRSENQKDRIIHGTDNRGEQHPLSKLNKKQVFEIRRLGTQTKGIKKIDKGGNYKSIAKKFNIAPSTVGQIVRGESWEWL